MAVRIRMKRLGRAHRPFYRICATDARAARDGRVIEELGLYDPMLKETDARARLNGERIDYWLSVGAQPSEKVKVLIKKYGTNGTHLEQQKAACERLKIKQQAPAPQKIELPAPPAEPVAETVSEQSDSAAETVVADAPSADEPVVEEPAAEG